MWQEKLKSGHEGIAAVRVFIQGVVISILWNMRIGSLDSSPVTE